MDPTSWVHQALFNIIAPGIGLLQQVDDSFDIPPKPDDPTKPDISGLLALRAAPDTSFIVEQIQKTRDDDDTTKAKIPIPTNIVVSMKSAHAYALLGTYQEITVQHPTKIATQDKTRPHKSVLKLQPHHRSTLGSLYESLHRDPCIMTRGSIQKTIPTQGGSLKGPRIERVRLALAMHGSTELEEAQTAMIAERNQRKADQAAKAKAKAAAHAEAQRHADHMETGDVPTSHSAPMVE